MVLEFVAEELFIGLVWQSSALLLEFVYFTHSEREDTEQVCTGVIQSALASRSLWLLCFDNRYAGG